MVIMTCWSTGYTSFGS